MSNRTVAVLVLLLFLVVGGIAVVVATRSGGHVAAIRPVQSAPAAARRPAPARGAAPARHRRRAARLPTLHLPARLPTRTVRLPILMYHRIDRPTAGMPAVTRGLTVSPRVFAGEMQWIASHGFHTVTQLQVWNSLMHGGPLPAHPVLVTFDDAYRDVVTYAAPVLHRHHQHATAYVITNRLSHGRITPWMTWDDLRLLQRDGFDIGSHTVSHADLVAVGATEAWQQLRDSRLALERFLHEPVQWLAYPYGAVDPAVERLAARAGYVLAVTTHGGTLQPADEPLLLDRQEVTGTMGVAGVAGLLSSIG